MNWERKKIVLLVNGHFYEVETMSHESLAEVLREKLHLTGTKIACDGGECGSCTVLVEGKPILSCLALAWDMEGKRITTVEGLAQGGELSELQKAFLDEGAVQCGFCTPGMLISAYALLTSHPAPTREEIKEALSGNLCRCTGYLKAIRAVEKLVEKQR